MSDTYVAPGGEGATAPVVTTPASTEPLTAREAARALANERWNRDNAKEEPAKAEETRAEPSAETAAAEPQESEAKADDDAQPQADPVEPQEDAPAVEEQPSVDPPRSWTKEAKEAFKLLPPALQKDVAELERSREVEVRRGQNEAAEQRKAGEAARQQAEQVRQQYEVALQALHQEISKAQAGEFGDIKTQEDVEKLANEDWPRFARWQAHQMKVDAVAREAKAAQDRQAQEFEKHWTAFANEQDQKLIERAPELADKSKAGKIADNAVSALKDYGFTEQELGQLWNGKASVSLRDHRLQLLILDGVKYREAKANVAKPAPKLVPPVQRPGVSRAPTSAADAEIQNLRKAFERNPTARTAAALQAAERRSA